MWYRNKKTGLEWDVTHQDTIERLKKDQDYEAVEGKPGAEVAGKKVKEKKEPANPAGQEGGKEG
jgi:hypothetical protein